MLVVTPAAFNRHTPPLVCPVTSGGASARLAGFTVSLMNIGLKTTGVVLCSQMRSLDLRARRARRIERVPDEIIAEVLAVIHDILE